ncbi:tRNA (adenosine(37)-N6)-threonylcarbamoyltransferase complex transferase subunit TsaD [Tumebacillus sp. ITR2]|uniref:tRNA N6-adenosine threonylcarbamoyltransferase n=1 Tax=Tumebacillus amylolyticus TaxID=2801339 RepID=A0ABS1JGI9_9BACL|nr:tRNA (adenosine(37)-N6)-threonylcarbamoyltransferase complex transferase subunit TsaD [Tumebacillus amylolyticus]MBL0389352.1 tRNA (adenosine(37)-N6)-threonylcarbamoyltransferase complex transferase subunit TsaD [Tumebacillus amylolyticus]
MGFQQRVRDKYNADRASGKPVVILGIETSCDETSASVIRDGNEILSNVVSSQIEIHKRFGGVVPEVASRRHVENVNDVVEEALTQAGMTIDDLSAVGVTYGPGLVGALLVGVSWAKALCWAKSIPMIGVQHIAGHIYANFLSGGMEPPLLALVVSGGHTEIVHMPAHGEFEFLGRTRDDAAGEAYDKVARAMGLPYPGGPQIDRLALEGNPEAYAFPRAWIDDESMDFSFSGLKSAVLNTMHNAEQRGEPWKQEDISASFQAAVVEVLVEKTVRAVRKTGVNNVVVAGGVAANRGLRAALAKRAEEVGFSVHFPTFDLCTDNAAMIAAAAFPMYEKGRFHDLDLNAIASLSLTKWADTPTIQFMK